MGLLSGGCKDNNFYKYFKENMDDLGLPAPESLFSSVTTTVASIEGFAKFVDKFGTRVTVGEMIGAGAASEQLATASAVLASIYVGACIGSLLVATQRYAWCGDTILDIAEVTMALARDYQLRLSSKLYRFFAQNPGLLSSDTNFRRVYEHKIEASFR